MNIADIPTLSPRLKVLSKEQARAIHNAALEILATTGFKMEHPGVRDMLLAAGCKVLEDDWLTMPADLIDRALQTAPRRIDLYDQLGNQAMRLEGENCYYGTGSDAIFTHDLETGRRREAMLGDVANFARLVDGLEHLDFVMSMSNPKDVDIGSIYVAVFGEIVKNTSKPVVFIADSGADIARIHQIAALVCGGMDKVGDKPFLLNYSEAISPLRFPQNVMEKLIYCAKHRIPICLPSGSNAGGGAPVTLAGAMALGIAENLVGLVIHQMVREGSPFLFGPNVSALDMKSTVVSYGCPEWSLTQAALADMRDELYGLPIWAYAGASDAKILDAQAGAEAMFSISTGLLSRANLMHDVGFLEFGSTSSLEMVTMANELIAMSKFFLKGIPVNDDTLALEPIATVARGGAGAIFLTEDHTFEQFMTAQFLPRLLDRTRHDAWKAAGGLDMYQRCNEEAKRVLAEHEVAPKSPEVLEQIKAIVAG
jgi:trimethylamine--corrinoid protein Co-methyltransferase